MRSINRVHLIGFVDEPPVLRQTQSGTSVVTVKLKTEELVGTPTGSELLKRQLHRVVVFGKQAEHCVDWYAPGREIHVEGRLQTRKWVDDKGVERRFTEVVASRVRHLGGKGG